jgi:putative lipoprotein
VRHASALLVCLAAGCAHTAPEATATRPFPTRFQCGDLVAAVDFQGERARLTIGQTDYEMRQTRTANGARYEAVNDPTTWFWNVGRGGTLSWKGRQYPECRELTASPADLQGVEWVVEDLNGGGIIDRSRATLVFGADGRLSGRASCNTYTAEYAASGDTVRVSNVAGTARACAPSLMAQEQRFYDALKAATRFEFRADGALVLHAGDGRRILARRGGPA